MINGWVDLTRTVGGVRPQISKIGGDPGAGPLLRVELPGACVEAGGPGVDLHAGTESIVACRGKPRFDDRALGDTCAKSGPALAWSELIERRGERAAAFVRGPFSLLALDLRNRRAIFATDRFSIHPICYANEGSRLVFADRADSVPLAGSPELDRQALFDYLYFHVIPAPRTIFRGVERLPAAHTLVVSASGARVFPHWTPEFREQGEASIDVLHEEFKTLLRDAVAREIDTPAIGCFLSGGTDSSTVTGFLGEITGNPPAAFSIGFDAQGYDELEYARIAAKHFGADHHEYYVTPEDLVRSIPEVAAHYDQPFGNSSALPGYCCARLARESGIAKLLAGDGGDELFGGNARYAKQKIFGAYEIIPAALRRGLVEPLLLGVPGAGRLPLLRKLASYVGQARVPMPERMETYNLLARLSVAEVLEPEFLASVDPAAPARAQRETYAACSGTSLVERMLEYDWKYTLADNDLPKVCGTAALAGVRVGFPFLADEIVDFSLRLPASFKVRGLRLRHFFKAALRGFLPDAIIAKRKHGFGLPFGVWLTRHEGLRSLARSSFTDLASRGIVRPSFLDALIDRKLAEHPAFYGEMVWILIMLEQWLRTRARSAAAYGTPSIAKRA